MLCQKCGINTATTHIRKSINGVQEELMLCSDCAAKLGYNELSFFSGGLLGSLLAGAMADKTAANAVRCPGCGISFEEIARTGKVGCAGCYTQFGDRLTPTIERLHGRAGHIGKVPENARKKKPEKPLAERLKEELAQAIEAQEFEKAAQLRDQIKELEESGHDNR